MLGVRRKVMTISSFKGKRGLGLGLGLDLRLHRNPSVSQGQPNLLLRERVIMTVKGKKDCYSTCAVGEEEDEEDPTDVS